MTQPVKPKTEFFNVKNLGVVRLILLALTFIGVFMVQFLNVAIMGSHTILFGLFPVTPDKNFFAHIIQTLGCMGAFLVVEYFERKNRPGQTIYTSWFVNFFWFGLIVLLFFFRGF